MYGCNYLILDKHTRNALVELKCKAMRALMGFLAHSTPANVEESPAVKHLLEIAEKRKNNQLIRLQALPVGRDILSTFAPTLPRHPPIAKPIPRREFVSIVGHKSLLAHRHTSPKSSPQEA